MPGSQFGGGRYRLASSNMGDPFWGALAGLAVKGVGKLVGKVVGKKALPIVKEIATTTAIMQLPRVALPVLVGTGAAAAGIAARVGGAARRIAPLAIGTGVAGVAAAGGAALLGGERRRFRRMNPLNPKALKRATRRLAGFHVFATSTASELRKLAPRSSTRCAPRKAVCR